MGKKKIHFGKEALNSLLPYTQIYYSLPRKKKKAMKKRITKDVEEAILAYIDNHLSEHGELNLTTEI